jgi:hypothetical protein
MPEIHYTVDGKPQKSNEIELTPAQILRNAGLDPDESYLVEIRGDRRESYHDHPHAAIRLHDRQVFESSHRTVHYFVDDEVQITREHQLSPNTILKNATLDPASHYLVRIEGHHRESYRDKPNDPIVLVQQERFISVSLGATPVS